jgi:uncharacterized membrane protein
MENGSDAYGAGYIFGFILLYAIVIAVAVVLFRLLMRQVRAQTRNAVLGALVIFIVFAGGVVYLCGDTFGTPDAVALLVLGAVMIYEVRQTNKRFRAGKTFR